MQIKCLSQPVWGSNLTFWLVKSAWIEREVTAFHMELVLLLPHPWSDSSSRWELLCLSSEAHQLWLCTYHCSKSTVLCVHTHTTLLQGSTVDTLCWQMRSLPIYVTSRCCWYCQPSPNAWARNVPLHHEDQRENHFLYHTVGC